MTDHDTAECLDRGKERLRNDLARGLLAALVIEVTERFGRSALASPAGQRALTFLAGEE